MVSQDGSPQQPETDGKKRKVANSVDNEQHSTKTVTAKKVKKNMYSSLRKPGSKKRLFTTHVEASGGMLFDEHDKDDLGCLPISHETIPEESAADSGCGEDEDFPCAQELLDEITPPELKRSCSRTSTDVGSRECLADEVSVQLCRECAADGVRVQLLAEERFRRETFAYSVMDGILATKYIVPSSVAGGNKSEYLAICDICENALSFTIRVMTKNGKAYKIGLSPSRYLTFQAGKKIELTVEDLHTAFRRISDVLIERLDNPDTGTQTVIVGYADKLSIECVSVNSEVRLSLTAK